METWLILFLVYLASVTITLIGAAMSHSGKSYVSDADRNADLILILMPGLNSIVAFCTIVVVILGLIRGCYDAILSLFGVK